jgi:hypothetical protein
LSSCSSTSPSLRAEPVRGGACAGMPARCRVAVLVCMACAPRAASLVAWQRTRARHAPPHLGSVR